MHLDLRQMDRNVPIIDGCCEKEAYAFFGLAAYIAQVIEHAALNLAIVLNLPKPGTVTQQAFDELYESLSKKTLGRLLASNRAEIHLSAADESLLYEALELRNKLIHHFFRDHAESFVSVAGRKIMIQELQAIISKLSVADDLLTGTYAPLWAKYGVTQEFVDQQLEQMRQRALQCDTNA